MLARIDNPNIKQEGMEMKRTAMSYRYGNDGKWEPLGVITCECSGEWSDGTKTWTEVGKPCGNQYSRMRTCERKYVFLLEATA